MTLLAYKIQFEILAFDHSPIWFVKYWWFIIFIYYFQIKQHWTFDPLALESNAYNNDLVDFII